MAERKLYSAFDPPPPVYTPVDKESRARQEFKDECDINRIMSRYRKTGVLPVSVGGGIFGDFTGVTDFQDAQNALLAAESQFKALPSEVRDRFKNSPVALLEFLSDVKNKDEAIKLGLIDAAPAPAGPMKVEVVNGVVPPVSGGK